MAGTSLTVSPDQQGVLQAFGALITEACSMVAAAQRAPDLARTIDENGKPQLEKPDGMSDRDYRIACDALSSSRNAPLYLTEAYRMRETAHKIAAGLGNEGAPKLVHHVVHTVVAKVYERVPVGKAIDVAFEEKKDG